MLFGDYRMMGNRIILTQTMAEKGVLADAIFDELQMANNRGATFGLRTVSNDEFPRSETPHGQDRNEL